MTDGIDVPAWFAIALVGFLSIGLFDANEHLIYYDESNTSYVINGTTGVTSNITIQKNTTDTCWMNFVNGVLASTSC